MEDEEPTEEIETPKNKWLYTNDSFGKLEKDVVSDDKVYKRGGNETKIKAFKIINKKSNGGTLL